MNVLYSITQPICMEKHENLTHLWDYQMVLMVKYSLMLIITMECIILNHAPRFSWLNKEGESFKIKIKMN
jgi:hypothetical protein